MRLSNIPETLDADPSDAFLATMRDAGATHAGATGDAGSWHRWAVFPLAEAAEAVEIDASELAAAWEEVDRETLRDVAEALTGWHSYGSAPGHAFAHAPGIRISRHRILVTQFGGLDI